MSNEDRGDMQRQQRLRECAIRNLSPGARHQAFPALFAKPMPEVDGDPRAHIARLSRENADLRKTVDRLTQERDELSGQLAAAAKATLFGPPPSARKTSIAAVQAAFCEALGELGYRVNRLPYLRIDLVSDRRSREMAWPRHVCMDLVRRLCPDSLPAIGKAFSRDHTSVIHGIKHTPDHLATDPVMAEAHARVMARFGAGQS